MASMAGTLMTRKQGMVSVESLQPQSATGTSGESGQSTNLNQKNAGNISEQAAEDLPDSDKELAEGKGGDENDPQRKAAMEKLRAALRKKLKEKLSAEKKGNKAEEEAVAAFDGRLTGPQAGRSLASAGEPEEAKKENPVFAALQQARFSMDPAETDAQVRSMIGEIESADRESRDRLHGILNADSESLFERVRAIHQSCLRKKCVTASS